MLHAKRKQILIVEDNRDILESLSMLLEERYDVALAADGGSGFQRLMERTFDVVLVDMMMPVMTGLQLVAKAREHGVSTPFVLMSATLDIPQRTAVVGVAAALLKPFDAAVLERTLERVMELRRPTRGARTPMRAST